MAESSGIVSFGSTNFFLSVSEGTKLKCPSALDTFTTFALGLNIGNKISQTRKLSK